MSLFRVVVVALATLFLFAGFAAAGDDYHPDHHKDHDDYDHHKDYDDYDHHKIYWPKCKDKYKKWEWTYNSYGHNPCKIAAYLLSTCYGGIYRFPGLDGKDYYDPCKDGLCECNTVIYSLISACEACQGGKWPYFKDYVKYCKKVSYPGRFPYPVPYGTKIPKWAFLDVTVGNNWDPVKAEAVGGVPEADEGTDLSG